MYEIALFSQAIITVSEIYPFTDRCGVGPQTEVNQMYEIGVFSYSILTIRKIYPFYEKKLIILAPAVQLGV